MRRLAFIFLLQLYVFANTEIHELFALPSLVRHYHEHLAVDSSIGMIDFLMLHYANESHDHDHSHHGLPFKDHSVHAWSFTPIVVPDDFDATLNCPEAQSILRSPRNSNLRFASLAASIWQPPRF